METTEIYKVKTSRGELQYKFVDEYEGMIRMLNAKTIKTYQALESEHPDVTAFGVFFAFSDKQFHEGYDGLVARGFIKQGDKVFSMGAGGYGTKEGIDKVIAAYEDRDKLIKVECDPQEVYFYEHANHESQINWDGDMEAIRQIIRIWGVETAREIKRHNVAYSIEHIVKED